MTLSPENVPSRPESSVVAVDIGGTHARFAVARLANGRVAGLGAVSTFKTADHASFPSAWQAFADQCGPLPRAAAIAMAGPVSGDILRFTNNPWVIRPSQLPEQLGVDRWTVVNDFEAVGHAIAQSHPSDLELLCGPDTPLPATGTITVVGPGTGLGVAWVRRDGDNYHVQPTEGGHIDYAPLDSIEDAILNRLRHRYRRVSVERVVSGPGLADIRETLAALEGKAIQPLPDAELWRLGASGTDRLASTAVERFCLSLGSVAGDIALAQGAAAVVIAGGLGLRIRDTLLQSGFAERFRAKGRFEQRMATLPVWLITHPQPGLFGAAAAFSRSFRDQGRNSTQQNQ